MSKETERNNEIAHMLEGVYGIVAVANVENAVTCNREWIEDGRYPIVYWQGNIKTACENAQVGSVATNKGTTTQAEVTIMPVEVAYGPLTSSNTRQRMKIQRIQFLLGVPGKRWLGATMVGTSPTDAELALLDNWTNA